VRSGRNKALTSRGLALPDEEARRISQIGGTSLGD
jgi:hypothetical protein